MSTSSISPTSPIHPVATPIKILLVAASPTKDIRSRAAVEFRKIIDGVARTPAKDRIQFSNLPAPQFSDLRTALLKYEPHILHISSQGSEDGSLNFEPDDWGRCTVSKKQLLRLLETLNDNLRLVFFNAWHSLALARDLPPVIDLALGIDLTIPDGESIDFAVSFYETLAYGKTVEKAFRVALASLQDGNDDLPVLFPNVADDRENKRKQILFSDENQSIKPQSAT